MIIKSSGKRLTTRSIATAEAIRDREPFVTSGALRAEAVEPPDGRWRWTGYLSGSDLAQFSEDCAEITYIVYSYATPIAWWTEAGGWYIVKARFSPTTTKHQGNLYLARISEG